jgi:hypothetical protein
MAMVSLICIIRISVFGHVRFTPYDKRSYVHIGGNRRKEVILIMDSDRVLTKESMFQLDHIILHIR